MAGYGSGAESAEMLEILLDGLPSAQRVALGYADRGTNRLALGLFALDAHCARLLRQSREPMLAQMRLAWWRETLAQAPEARPAGDPLLELLARWAGEEPALVGMVEGWEHLLGAAPLGMADFARFGDGRAGVFAALARLLGMPEAGDHALRAGRRWALADLANHLADGQERQTVLELAAGMAADRIPMPRRLRWLTVLDGLARRSLTRCGAPLLADRMSALVALRLGMIGR